RPQARTHSARLSQPDRLRPAGRRITPQRGDELRDGGIRNALADFLTRDHEHGPRARPKGGCESTDQRALPDPRRARDQARLVTGATHATPDRFQSSQLEFPGDEWVRPNEPPGERRWLSRKRGPLTG